MKFGLLSIIVLFSLSAADNSNYDADDAGWKVELDGRNQPQLKSAQLPFKLGRGREGVPAAMGFHHKDKSNTNTSSQQTNTNTLRMVREYLAFPKTLLLKN